MTMRAVLIAYLLVAPFVFAASTVPRPKTTTAPPETAEEISSEESIDWECGTDSFTKYISENQIDIDCPALKKTVNQCCLTHDSCYEDQRGRKFCDDTFCHCLEVATKPSKICSKEDGPLFCNLVRDFGEEAYRRSGNGTASKEEEKPLVHDLEPELKNVTEALDYEAEVGGHHKIVHSMEQTARKLAASEPYSSH